MAVEKWGNVTYKEKWDVTDTSSKFAAEKMSANQLFQQCLDLALAEHPTKLRVYEIEPDFKMQMKNLMRATKAMTLRMFVQGLQNFEMIDQNLHEWINLSSSHNDYHLRLTNHQGYLRTVIGLSAKEHDD